MDEGEEGDGGVSYGVVMVFEFDTLLRLSRILFRSLYMAFVAV